MQFTERHDGVLENDHREPSVNASNTEQGLTEFHQEHEESGLKESTELGIDREKRDNGVAQEDGEQRNKQCSNGDLKGERTTDRLAAISEESDDEALKWRISDVFSGLDDSPKEKP